MNKQKVKYVQFIIYLVASCLLSIGNAQVSLSPLFAKLEPASDGQNQTTFRVSNASGDTLRFRAAFSYFVFDERAIQIVSEAIEANDLSPYLRAAPLEFEVPAYSDQIIRVIALVPPSALTQEMRAALVIEPLNDDSMGEQVRSGNLTGQLSFQYRFVAQLYISPVSSTSLQLEGVQQDPDGNLQIIVSNNGEATSIASLNWQLAQGNQIIATSQTESRLVVLTNSQRTSNLVEGIRLAPGRYTLSGTFGTDDGGEPPVILNPQPFTKTFTVK